MKFCPNCHLTYDDSANVCGQCGTPLSYIPNEVISQPAVDPADHTAEFDPADISENKVMAMAAYLLGALGIVIAMLAAGSSPYTGFHVKQALKLTVFTAIVTVIGVIIPFVGWLAACVWIVIALVLTIIALVGIGKGQARELPIIKNVKFLK